MSGRGLFVSGTDTGVGKTLVSCALLRAARERGIDLVGMKAIETGVGPQGARDAQALREAAGASEPLETLCPQQFALPAAPNVAAAAEGRPVELDPILRAFEQLRAAHSGVLVEGAGGLLVPTHDSATMADLAHDLHLPVLIVTRAALGTINHTRLTLGEIERRGLPLLGVVISHEGGVLSQADQANCAALRRELAERLVGEIPALDADEVVPERALQLDRLLKPFQPAGRDEAARRPADG